MEAIERYRHLAEEEARRRLAAFARALELSHAIQAARRGPASLRIREPLCVSAKSPATPPRT